MYQGIIKNISLNLDINAEKRVEGNIDVKLYSKDIGTGVFEFSFIDEKNSKIELDETYSAKVMIKLNQSENIYVTDMEIDGDIARFVFPHGFITKDGTVTLYVYLTKNDKTSDVASISFNVFKSEIDDVATDIVTIYDKNYESILNDFEEYINLSKEEWKVLIEKTENFVEEIENITLDQFIEMKMDEKYNNIEQNYITRLLKTEQDVFSLNEQLAHNTQVVNDAVSKVTVDSEVILARGGKTTLGERIDEIVVGEGLADDAVTIQKAEFIIKSKNLFNKDTAVDGFGLDLPSGELVSSSTFTTSDFIPIKPSSVVYKNLTGALQEYDEEYNRVAGYGAGHGARSYNLTANTKYLRVSMEKHLKDFYQLEYGEEGTPYQPHGLVELSKDIKVSSESLNSQTNAFDFVEFDKIDVPVELPFNVYKGLGEYVTDINPTDFKVPVTKRYYVDKVNGTSSGSGSETEPLNAIHRATNKGDADEIIVKSGKYGWSSGFGSSHTARPVNIIGDGDVIIGSFRENVVWTAHETLSNVYQTRQTNVYYIVDLTDIENPIFYNKLNSQEDVNLNEHSWYVDENWNISINTGDGLPHDDIYLMLNNPSMLNNDVNTYLENITFLSTMHSDTTVLPKKMLFANKCKFYMSFGNNAVSITGSDSIMYKCKAKFGDRDGFNYHQRNDIKPFAIEIDCVGMQNGRDGANQNNGTTMHDGGTIVRIGGTYERNSGPNVIDVNEGGKSYNYGVKASRSTATAGTISNTDFKNGNVGKSDMLLVDCVSHGSSYSVVTQGGGNTTIEGGLILGQVHVDTKCSLSENTLKI